MSKAKFRVMERYSRGESIYIIQRLVKGFCFKKEGEWVDYDEEDLSSYPAFGDKEKAIEIVKRLERDEIKKEELSKAPVIVYETNYDDGE